MSHSTAWRSDVPSLHRRPTKLGEIPTMKLLNLGTNNGLNSDMGRYSAYKWWSKVHAA